MIEPLGGPEEGPVTLLFGPLALSFDEAAFKQVRGTVLGTDDHRWAVQVLQDLPSLGKAITEVVPSLQAGNGVEQLEKVKHSLQSGDLTEISFPLSNTTLIPLVVISHLTQYASFLQSTGADLNDCAGSFTDPKRFQEALGFCTGLLSAFAVSSAGDKDLFHKYGAVAVRLGLLIGMVVDAQDANSEFGPSKSLSAAWNSAETGEELLRILQDFPEAYVSVHYDEHRATITTAAGTISKLLQRLKASGIIASEVGLYGRFHANCNRETLDLILKFCDANPAFQFPDASKLVIATRSNNGDGWITKGPLHHYALRSILAEPPRWLETFKATHAAHLTERDALVVSIGSERCVPASLMPRLGQQVIHLADLDPEALGSLLSPKHRRPPSDNDIAVIGMSCKVAGAENLEEFWDLLCAGKSQHKEVPKERFGFETTFREVDPKRKWFGNFIDGHDMFDHKFFKKSPRESATMDPQQRHLLQIAYQTVEQSGYFRSAKPDRRVGCYIGVCACDYENNIACHAPNAFSATGNLQGFIAGKVSHYFGWTGPGLTIDTACSSSAVAVHQACRAIISGECNAALAGGTHVITSPLWFQNLAGASFLSLTGQCKPFDAKADGYCRGEGIAAVYLKKLSAAVADGDQILGIIAASAVQQNENCTPIFVPNVPSLSDLFRGVTQRACLQPAQISVVEAHGTGTAVGDPAEYESIRTVLGGSARASPLILSSVKGLVGHIECTSGIVSLIKILLMIQKGKIPPQASFSKINPAINSTPADNMTIPTSLKPWDADFRAALINNYGASGSNASIILTQSPFTPARANRSGARLQLPASAKLPFWLCGMDDRSLRRYCQVLGKFLKQNSSLPKDLTLANICFNVARQSNRLLDRGLMFTAQSVRELEQKLSAFEKSDDASLATVPRTESRPVVLCFGGQVSTFVGLDREVYDNVTLLRKHLRSVDAMARRIGAPSIFPGIFERAPARDAVQLQTMLFAMQYSCALSWIDSGIQPVAVVGHSFGELTALCVSQVLSLEDALRMIMNRATIVRDAWGSDKGSMMAVEADLSDVQRLLDASMEAFPSEQPASIACYNGPRSFTLAGPTASIDAVAATASRTTEFSSMRTKRLNVTNAFHCSLLDPLLESMEQCAKGLTFHEPTVHLERATELPTVAQLTPKFVADHIRSPVFFNHAVQRLAERYPSCIFLEAGSNSTITSMASRALGNPKSSHFQAVNITNDSGWSNLTDATMSLWKSGLGVQHWAHSASQTKEYTPLLLPPYQFERSCHWVELKAPPKAADVRATTKRTDQDSEELPKGLLTFFGYQDDKKHSAKFRVNTMIPRYDAIIAGHIIAQTAPICPATVQLDLVIEAIRSLRPDLALSNLEPQVQHVENQSPICVNPARAVWVQIEKERETTDSKPSWVFQVFSTDTVEGAARTVHTTGRVIFCSTDDLALKLELARFERLIGHQRCVHMLQSGDVDEILQHRNIYKMFAEIVDYGEEYRGLQKLVGRGNRSAGLVVKKYNPETWLDAHLADSFCQVGGIWVNCMTDRPPTDMFIANGIERWIRSPKLRQEDPRPDAFHVLATHHRPTDKMFLTDVFVFDAMNGALLEVILGISYCRVPKSAMSKILVRLTATKEHTDAVSVKAASVSSKVEPVAALPSTVATAKEQTQLVPRKVERKSAKTDVVTKVKAILAELSGLELHEIGDDSDLADLGIDSLMGMEMAHEIESAFKITLPESELMAITDMPGLIKCVQATVNDGVSAEEPDAERFDDIESKSDDPCFSPPDNVHTDLSSASVETDTDEDADGKEACGGLRLPLATVIEAFNETKSLTDERIAEYGQGSYFDTVLPMQTQMCIALTLEAFEQLGCAICTAEPGQKLPRISHPEEHRRLVDYLYLMLEKESGLINVDGAAITRTAVPPPSQSSKEVLENLLERFPDQNTADRLTFYTGSNLARVLRGETDGIKLIFGTAEGRELVSGMYGEWPLNRLFYKQMEDFLGRLVSKLNMRETESPLKILEMGAGTGGTTRWLVPLLAELNVPVEYTFTDLAPSFVAAARKRFKPYPFMRFRAHDIENSPEDDLVGTQHVVIASNAVHATHSLCESTRNMRKLLRPDGFLMMLEMTGTMYWVDMVFGLFEGWWFFDDGRTQAVTDERRWEKDLQSVGYGHVDWTDGSRPENKIEKVIIAMASGPRCERLHVFSIPAPVTSQSADCAARQAVVDSYVRDMTDGFHAAVGLDEDWSGGSRQKNISDSRCVLVTGATGSLGSHLVAHLALLPGVRRVVCLNRWNKQDPRERQLQALAKRGIAIPEQATNKLVVLQTDLSKPDFGLSGDDYENLVATVTHVVHNAWLMNAKWPIRNFEPHLRIMRNMIFLAGRISSRRPPAEKVNFLFVSSIATVGHWPIWTGKMNVPEDRMTIESVLPTGYGDAKYACERMLDETLHRHPDRFRAMTVRLGQVAGSSTSGYWNPMEHLSFIIKSSQTVGALPDFDGLLSWTPLDDVAGTVADLLLLPEETASYPFYHIDNPVRQLWKDMIPVLAHALGIPRQSVVPFQEWLRRVKDYPRQGEGPDGDNPAILLIDFLDDNFLRMSCGGLLLDTKKAREHSRTLANVGPVSEQVTRLFVQRWKDMGFLR